MTRNAFYFEHRRPDLWDIGSRFFFSSSPPELLEPADECGRKDCVMLSVDIFYRENNVGLLLRQI